MRKQVKCAWLLCCLLAGSSAKSSAATVELQCGPKGQLDGLTYRETQSERRLRFQYLYGSCAIHANGIAEHPCTLLEPEPASRENIGFASDFVNFQRRIPGIPAALYDKLQACLESSRDKSRLTLYHPHNMREANRVGRAYDRLAVRDIILLALKENVDPYLALAILFMENAPKSDEKSRKYRESYGPFPASALIVTTYLGCVLPVTKLPKYAKSAETKNFTRLLQIDESLGSDANARQAAREAIQEFQEMNPLAMAEITCLHNAASCIGIMHQKKKPALDISDGATDSKQVELCSNYPYVPRAMFMPLYAADSSNLQYGGKRCCVDLKVPEPFTASATETELKNRLALRYVRDKIQQPIEKGSRKPFEWHVQNFNGRGLYAKWLDPQLYACWHGLDTNVDPVYGMVTADLMLHAIMGNSEIRALVDDLARENRQTVRSALCLERGPGPHAIAGEEFLGRMRTLLAGRAGCTSRGPQKSPVTFRPWRNLEELEKAL